MLTQRSQLFSDARTYWSPEAVKRVTGYTLEGVAKDGFIDLRNSGTTTLNATGQEKDADGKPVTKHWWEDIANDLKATTFHAATKEHFPGGGSGRFMRLLRNKRHSFGVVAQYFNVSAQTCIWTFTLHYVTEALGVTDKVARYWLQASLIIFLVFRFLMGGLMGRYDARKLLLIMCLLGVALSLFAMVSVNLMGVIAIISLSACISLLFPTIYGEALIGLGEDTKYGAAGLVMAIIGGATMPLVQSVIMDRTSPAVSYITVAGQVWAGARLCQGQAVSGPGGGRGAHHQLGGQHLMPRLPVLYEPECGSQGRTPQGVKVLEYAAQRRRGPACLGNVVKSHHRYVVGNPHPGREQLMADPQGDVVIASKYALWQAILQQMAGHPGPTLTGPRASGQPPVRHARLHAGVLVGGQAFGGVLPGKIARNVQQTPAATVQQVAGSQAGARYLVYGHGGEHLGVVLPGDHSDHRPRVSLGGQYRQDVGALRQHHGGLDSVPPQMRQGGVNGGTTGTVSRSQHKLPTLLPHRPG